MAEDFVLIKTGGALAAIAANRLAGVSELRPRTPVPLAPQEVEGLVTIRGAIAVVVDLGLRLTGQVSAVDQGCLLMLRDSHGGQLALHVDAVVGIERQAAVEPGDDQGPLIAGCLAGSGALVLADAALRLVAQQADAPRALPEATTPPPEARAQHRQMIALRSGKRSLALGLDAVFGLTDIDNLTPLPSAPAFVLGATRWRDAPRLVLGLDRLLGRRKPDPVNYVLWVGAQGRYFGLAISRFPQLIAVVESDQAAGTLTDAAGLLHEPACPIEMWDRHGDALQPYLGLAFGRLDEEVVRPSRSFLLLRHQDHRLAIPSERVARAQEWQKPQPLPNARRKAGQGGAGLVNLGGQVLPAVDLGAVLGMAQGGEPGVHLVLEGQGGRWAMAADAALRTVQVPRDAVRPVGEGVMADLIEMEDGPAWVLDVAQIEEWMNAAL